MSYFRVNISYCVMSCDPQSHPLNRLETFNMPDTLYALRGKKQQQILVSCMHLQWRKHLHRDVAWYIVAIVVVAMHIKIAKKKHYISEAQVSRKEERKSSASYVPKVQNTRVLAFWSWQSAAWGYKCAFAFTKLWKRGKSDGRNLHSCIFKPF